MWHCDDHSVVATRAGNTALHWAAAKGHVAVAKWLLSQGAPVNAPNNASRTALHSAVCNNQSELFPVLILQGGADVHLKDADDESPLHCASAAGGRHGEAARRLAFLSAAALLQEQQQSKQSRWAVRDMKALLAAAEQPTAGCERVALEQACATLMQDLPALLPAARAGVPAAVIAKVMAHLSASRALSSLGDGGHCGYHCTITCCKVAVCHREQ